MTESATPPAPKMRCEACRQYRDTVGDSRLCVSCRVLRNDAPSPSPEQAPAPNRTEAVDLVNLERRARNQDPGVLTYNNVLALVAQAREAERLRKLLGEFDSLPEEPAEYAPDGYGVELERIAGTLLTYDWDIRATVRECVEELCLLAKQHRALESALAPLLAGRPATVENVGEAVGHHVEAARILRLNASCEEEDAWQAADAARSEPKERK